MGTWGMAIFQDDHAQDEAANVVEAKDPIAYVDSFLRSLLEETDGGYDDSPHGGDWRCARKALAVVEVVRVARQWESRVRLARQVEEWLPRSGFRPTDALWDLAAQASRRLVDSAWLKSDWPELHEQVIVAQFRALTAET